MIKNKNIEIQQILNKNAIILFDGLCNLCYWPVKLILKRDSKDYFRFASLQSEAGKKILIYFNIPESFDSSVILIDDNSVYFKSEAVLQTVRKLRRAWPLIYFFIAIPQKIRDYLYMVISKNRFRWFGKRKDCYLTENSYSYKFL